MSDQSMSSANSSSSGLESTLPLTLSDELDSKEHSETPPHSSSPRSPSAHSSHHSTPKPKIFGVSKLWEKGDPLGISAESRRKHRENMLQYLRPENLHFVNDYLQPSESPRSSVSSNRTHTHTHQSLPPSRIASRESSTSIRQRRTSSVPVSSMTRRRSLSKSSQLSDRQHSPRMETAADQREDSWLLITVGKRVFQSLFLVLFAAVASLGLTAILLFGVDYVEHHGKDMLNSLFAMLLTVPQPKSQWQE